MDWKRNRHLRADRRVFSVVLLLAALVLCTARSQAQTCATPLDGCWSDPVELEAISLQENGTWFSVLKTDFGAIGKRVWVTWRGLSFG